MPALRSRISKLENHFGADDIDRWLRSLTDEELEAALAEVHLELRRRLEAFGEDAAQMTDEEVVRRLEEIEKANAK